MKRIPDADMRKCRKCNVCFDSCPEKAITVISNSSCAKCIKYCISFIVPCHPEYISFDYSRCNSCGECVDRCPNGAIYWSDAETVRLKKIERQ